MRSSQGIAGRSARVPHATVEVQTYDTWRGRLITWQEDRPGDGTLAEVGEFGLIAALAAWLPAGPRTLVGIGDDAAVLAVPDGRGAAPPAFLVGGRRCRRD